MFGGKYWVTHIFCPMSYNFWIFNAKCFEEKVHGLSYILSHLIIEPLKKWQKIYETLYFENLKALFKNKNLGFSI